MKYFNCFLSCLAAIGLFVSGCGTTPDGNLNEGEVRQVVESAVLVLSFEKPELVPYVSVVRGFLEGSDDVEVYEDLFRDFVDKERENDGLTDKQLVRLAVVADLVAYYFGKDVNLKSVLLESLNVSSK
ncbi:MAG: hypothetical protein R3213_10435 [Flavobacteriaceae bacterium]|nr:hypothetical protein [Flavobacteriaceae bacterium]